MTGDSVRFDQIRLAEGDYLICWRSPGPGCKGEGSYRAPHSRLLEGELPTTPLLDDILASESGLGEIATAIHLFGAVTAGSRCRTAHPS